MKSDDRYMDNRRQHYEVGRKIVEEKQQVENRAAYGQQLLWGLSEHLTKEFGKGFSLTNLKQFRQFYTIYVNDKISHTVSDQFANLPAVSTGRKFYLSWSHCAVRFGVRHKVFCFYSCKLFVLPLKNEVKML